MVCPNCKGKGHVLDALTACIPVWGVLLAVLERNDKSGFTRNPCVHCDVSGFIEER